MNEKNAVERLSPKRRVWEWRWWLLTLGPSLANGQFWVIIHLERTLSFSFTITRRDVSARGLDWSIAKTLLCFCATVGGGCRVAERWLPAWQARQPTHTEREREYQKTIEIRNEIPVAHKHFTSCHVNRTRVDPNVFSLRWN